VGWCLSGAAKINFRTVDCFPDYCYTPVVIEVDSTVQNFQETALSLERLAIFSGIRRSGASHIPMPDIRGAVKYENVEFRFSNSGSKQLTNINLDFPAGCLSGLSVKSCGQGTLTSCYPASMSLMPVAF